MLVNTVYKTFYYNSIVLFRIVFRKNLTSQAIFSIILKVRVYRALDIRPSWATKGMRSMFVQIGLVFEAMLQSKAEPVKKLVLIIFIV